MRSVKEIALKELRGRPVCYIDLEYVKMDIGQLQYLHVSGRGYGRYRVSGIDLAQGKDRTYYRHLMVRA